MAATTIEQRAFTCDVTIFALTYDAAAGSPTYDTLLGWFKDSTLRVDFDTVNAYVPYDTVNPDVLGFPHDFVKARRWSLDLSAVVAPTNDPADRELGWQLTAATAGVTDVVKLFTSLDLTYAATLMQARVPNDTKGGTSGDVAGWEYPRFKENNWEFEFQGLVDGATAANNPFDTLVQATSYAAMPESAAFAITGPNIVISGTGTPQGGQLTFGDETVTQNYRLKGQGPLTINTVKAGTMLSNILTGSGTGRDYGLVGIAIEQPGGGGTVFQGEGFFTSAKFTGSDGPNMQSGTITGRGALLSGATAPT